MQKSEKTPKAPSSTRVELGQYIVADFDICRGKPTFKGTRIMVWQVLEDVAEGRSWDYICNTRWGGRIPLAGITEAVRLARKAWLDDQGRLVDGLARKKPALAAA